MSILFVLLMFLVIVAINYFEHQEPGEAPGVADVVMPRPRVPVMAKEFEFMIPQGYSFHPGHAWVMKEGSENLRVGIDSFATDLAGQIDRIDVVSPGRWIRQGQRLLTVHGNDVSFDILSPVEGVVMAVNQDTVQDPMQIVRDPYKDGWVAMLKSPDYGTNQKNLMQGSMVAPWMHYNVSRLNGTVTAMNPKLAQDGGLPLKGLLHRVGGELRQKLIKEFFLN